MWHRPLRTMSRRESKIKRKSGELKSFPGVSVRARFEVSPAKSGRTERRTNERRERIDGGGSVRWEEKNERRRNGKEEKFKFEEENGESFSDGNGNSKSTK